MPSGSSSCGTAGSNRTLRVTDPSVSVTRTQRSSAQRATLKLTVLLLHSYAAADEAKEMAKGDLGAFHQVYLAHNQQLQSKDDKADLEARLTFLRKEIAGVASTIAEMDTELAALRRQRAAQEEERKQCGRNKSVKEAEQDAKLHRLDHKVAGKKVQLASIESRMQEFEASVADQPDFAALQVAVEQGLQSVLADLDDNTSQLSQRLCEVSADFAVSRPDQRVEWAREVMLLSAGAFETVLQAVNEQARLAKVHRS